MPALGDELPLLQDLEMFLDGGDAESGLTADGFHTGPAAAFVGTIFSLGPFSSSISNEIIFSLPLFTDTLVIFV